MTGGGWSGADRGAGWLRRRTLVVERAGRGEPRAHAGRVELPLAHDDWPAFLAEDDRGTRPAAGTGTTAAETTAAETAAAETAVTARTTRTGPAPVEDPDRPSRLRLVG